MTASQSLEAVLSGLAADRATGALRVGRAGTVYLTRGRVSHVESPGTPGVEEMLVASGRLRPATVRGVRQSAGELADGGERLVRQGLLTRGELQFCVLGATLDAAFFVLAAAGARTRFRPDDRHWIGDQWYFDVAGLFRECRRRRDRLDQVCPSPELDTRPVAPVPRVPAQRVVLTAVQWELLRHADGAATPADLARRLGRPVYAVLLAVRQLGAAGLLSEPEAAPDPPPGTDRGGPAATRAKKGPDAPPLPVRTRTGPRPAPAGDPADLTDIGVLIRLRDALERL
ncbi:hypothetical protein Sru01_33840 [Sphaerisporangium rufum]|uniref:Uncharacterized protein n=1 Tax=Sphaerisporangium rufum TaxID=1381558 RepID=A0A919V1B3_9ACTN|nr:hypothetical protein [Sphaerisporangium rufum]GII78402.1 hypothetical protein Sru01_33840 [Sphaerisporangium rufum]